MDVRTPGDLVAGVRARWSVELANPEDPLSLVTQTDSLRFNGNTTISTYTAATERQLVTTPEGRQFVTRLDTQGRVVSAHTADLDSVTFTYDPRPTDRRTTGRPRGNLRM